MAANAPAEKRGIFSILMDGLKEIFSPILIALAAAGILQGVVILLDVTGAAPAGSVEYGVFNTIAQSVFYFLPILLAYSSAKVFDTNQVLAVCAAFFLVHPNTTQFFASYAEAGAQSFYGITIPLGNYASSVIPIILIVWAQKYIEKLWLKIIPKIVSGIFSPMMILVSTILVGIFLLGPIGTFLGDGLVVLLNWINSITPWLAPTLLGAFAPFIVMVGAHYSLFPVVAQTLASTGVDTFFNPGMLASNVGLAGASFAAIFKSESSAYKQYSLTATVTAMLGVSQPALYGIALPHRQALWAGIIGGGAGGFYAGISGFYAYAFVNPGLAAFPAYLNPAGGYTNLIHAIITVLISFIVGFLIVFFTKFEDMPQEEINQLVAEGDDEVEVETESDIAEERNLVNDGVAVEDNEKVEVDSNEEHITKTSNNDADAVTTADETSSKNAATSTTAKADEAGSTKQNSDQSNTGETDSESDSVVYGSDDGSTDLDDPVNGDHENK